MWEYLVNINYRCAQHDGYYRQGILLHPKRQKALENAIDDTQPESSIHKVKDLCCTRWVHALQTFIPL